MWLFLSRSKLLRKRIALWEREFTTSVRLISRWRTRSTPRSPNFCRKCGKQQADRGGYPALKESEILNLLVFLLRVGKQETNGRPRSRAFLGFLRTRFPLPAEEDQGSIAHHYAVMLGDRAARPLMRQAYDMPSLAGEFEAQPAT